MQHNSEDSRHARQKMLPHFGEEGQEKLRGSRVALVGCGALGCAVADHLVRAGVGAITIIDRDVVELSNLQRQSLFDERDAAEGLPKAEAAKRRLGAIDGSVRIDAVVDDVTGANAERLIAGCEPAIDVIADGTDNFETRYVLNNLAVKRGVPYVYAGVVGTSGTQMTILPCGEGEHALWDGRGTACLRCVLPEPPAPGSLPTCESVGVLGPAVALVAAIESAEILKVLLGRWGDVRASLAEIDAWTGTVRRVSLESARVDDCPCCALRRFDFLGAGRGGEAVSLCGRASVQVTPAGETRIDLGRLAERLGSHGEFAATAFLVRGELRDERSSGGDRIGLTVFPSGRAIISGTTEPAAARSIYARYIGV